MIISHGDCAPSNIFIDGSNLCFIDAGQAKLRPALFDFIYLCLISNDFMFLKTMQDKYKVTISKIFKDKNMRYDDSVFDDYLYCFCKCFENLYSKINKPMDSKHIPDIFKPLVCVECKIFQKTYSFIFSKFVFENK